MSRPQKFLLILILLLAFTLRLYRINNPIADWHAFRQADTASVTREYVKHGIDLLHPKYQDLSNIQSGKDNLLGYRMVEFSLVNALTAWFLIKLPFLDLVIFSRLISVFFSLGTILALFYLVKNFSPPSLLPFYLTQFIIHAPSCPSQPCYFLALLRFYFFINICINLVTIH